MMPTHFPGSDWPEFEEFHRNNLGIPKPMNPTPTDPREGADLLFEITSQLEAAQSTNAKLAAEIAELKALLSSYHFDTSNPPAVVKAIIEGNIKDRAELETAKLTLFQTEKRLDDKLRTALAELEAVRKERDAVEKLKEMAHSAAVTWQQRAETYHEAVQRTEAERDTALAAKDAAEKRVVELEADSEHFHEVRDEFRDKLEMLRDELRVTRKSRDEAIASGKKACLEASETIAILESRIKELETLIKEGKRTKDRVVELEASLDELSSVVGLTAFKHEGQRAVLQEAFDNARALLANRPISS